MSAEADIAIVGGGISGLSIAEAIERRSREAGRPLRVIVLEAEAGAGGKIRSAREDGFVLDLGPHGFLDREPAVFELIDRLGLRSSLLRANEASAMRYVVRGGKLRAVPESPPAFLKSDILPLAARLRVVAEPLAKRRPEGVDETVWDFAARRIGAAAADWLIDAIVTGTYGGDPKLLSLKSAFPRMRELENQYGSLIKAQLAIAKEKKKAEAAARPQGSRAADDAGSRGAAQPSGSRGAADDAGSRGAAESSGSRGAADDAGSRGAAEPSGSRGAAASSGSRAAEASSGSRASASRASGVAAGAPSGTLHNFREGLGELTSALAKRSEVRTKFRVSRVLRDAGGRFRLEGSGEPAFARAVIFTVPAYEVRPLLAPFAEEEAKEIGAIPYAPISLVVQGFRRSELGRTLDGFGFLAPHIEARRILGSIWASTVFPEHVPEGAVMFRTMLGGRRRPELAALDDAATLATAHDELAALVGINRDAKPIFERVVRWERAIPQYEVGHDARVAAADRAEQRVPGLFFSGNAFRGIAMIACVVEADRVATRVLAHLLGGAGP